jgi:hypothetical protein
MSARKREGAGLFWSGIAVLLLGVVASLAWGAADGQRLFFLSSVLLVGSRLLDDSPLRFRSPRHREKTAVGAWYGMRRESGPEYDEPPLRRN